MTQKSKFELSEVRALSQEELDSVSGAQKVRIPMGGQVDIWFNTKNGMWVVALSGKAVYFDGGPPPV